MLLPGCGVSPAEHQAVVRQLTDAKNTLDTINSTQGMTANSDRDYAANLAALQSQLKDLRDQRAALTEQISKLEAQEEYVFQSAGAKLDAKDFPGALAAYKQFVEQFPSSRRLASAKKIIAGIEQRLKTSRHA